MLGGRRWAVGGGLTGRQVTKERAARTRSSIEAWYFKRNLISQTSPGDVDGTIFYDGLCICWPGSLLFKRDGLAYYTMLGTFLFHFIS